MQEVEADQDRKFFETVQKAIDFGGTIGSTDIVDAFNVASEHVLSLLGDGASVFHRGSFGTSVFLSITAMEETAKAHLLGFRAGKGEQARSRRGDPMHDHKQKHIVAIGPTTFMGRLPILLGAEACARLRDEAIRGDFGRLREIALYVHADERGVRSPRQEISKSRACEILLLALEAADDALVGLTDASYEIGQTFERLFREVSRELETGAADRTDE